MSFDLSFKFQHVKCCSCTLCKFCSCSILDVASSMLFCLQQHEVAAEVTVCAYVQVADNATLYGVCLLVQEIVQRPPAILGPASPISQFSGGLARFLVSAPRCYCVLTRVPFFELHYEMLNRLALFFWIIVDYCKIHMFLVTETITLFGPKRRKEISFLSCLVLNLERIWKSQGKKPKEKRVQSYIPSHFTVVFSLKQNNESFSPSPFLSFFPLNQTKISDCTFFKNPSHLFPLLSFDIFSFSSHKL